MAGTRSGGLQAAKTNKERYGNDWYAKIGKIGGQLGNTGGFATPVPCNCTEIDEPHFKRQCAGKKGGALSRRKAKQ